MAPPTRMADHRYLSIAVGYVVIVATVAAPMAVGAGVVAARLAKSGEVFPVILSVTILCGLLSGILAAPDLRLRIERAAARSPVGRGSSGF